MEQIDKEAIGTNIYNAYELVRESHKQIEKLLDVLDEIGSEAVYKNLTKGFFLRYNSDKNRWGWLYGSFTKVFTQKGKSDLLYSIEINFDRNELGVPMLLFGTHFYEKGTAPQKFYPPDGWIFQHRRDVTRGFDIKKLEDGFYVSKPDTTTKKEHNGLLAFKYQVIPLLNIERNNIKSQIFDIFKKIILN